MEEAREGRPGHTNPAQGRVVWRLCLFLPLAAERNYTTKEPPRGSQGPCPVP